MNTDRYNALMRDEDLPLTLGEQRRGWHFCPDYDGILICPIDTKCECDLPKKATRRAALRLARYFTRKRTLAVMRSRVRAFNSIPF